MTQPRRRPSLRDLDQLDHVTEEDIIRKVINWETYLDKALLTKNEVDFLNNMQNAPKGDRIALMSDEDGDDYARVFVGALSKLSDEEPVQYLLALVETILTDDPDNVRHFYRIANHCDPFLGILRRDYPTITIATTSKIVARLLSSVAEEEGDTATEFVDWLNNRLENPVGKRKMRDRDQVYTLNALKILLNKHSIQTLWVKRGGVTTLNDILADKVESNGQIVYLVGFCLWLLSFHDENIGPFGENDMIKQLVNALRAGLREKVSRIVLATLNNLLDKHDFNTKMIDAQIMKTLVQLETKKWVDEDIEELITGVYENLQKDVRILSSTDKYEKELKSELFEWGPVHSENFWREHAQEFHADNFRNIKYLVALLESPDPTTIAIVCNDIGEFVRFSPMGKRVIVKLGAKPKLMEKMQDENQDVSKQALLCVQKLLVKNWEFLQRPQKVL